MRLSNKLLGQEYARERLKSFLRKFYGRYSDLIKQYEVPLSQLSQHIIWNNCPAYLKDRLEKVNIEAARIVTGATKLVSLNDLYRETGWETLEKRREKHKLIQFFKITNGLTPQYLQQLVPPQYFEQHFHNTRHSQNYVSVNSRTNYRHNSFIPSTIRLWNNLPAQLKQCNTLLNFKRELSSYYKNS